MRPIVRDMLSESMRHVLGVLREVAEHNAAAEVGRLDGAVMTRGVFPPILSLIRYVRVMR